VRITAQEQLTFVEAIHTSLNDIINKPMPFHIIERTVELETKLSEVNGM